MHWDVFCQVVDNHGDVGVCWRLARELAARGQQVRLWVDDARALAWMAPEGAAGVAVLPWAGAEAGVGTRARVAPGDVVVEAFGCTLPAAFVQRMASAELPPLWLNLEYLSAEAYVERSHQLPSPVLSGLGQGLHKWFFYPGFTPATGGLLREADLPQRQADFNAEAWLAGHGLRREPGELLISLFWRPWSLGWLKKLAHRCYGFWPPTRLNCHLWLPRGFGTSASTDCPGCRSRNSTTCCGPAT
jgi:uncharacterized repeat protein (TIGR03837 family)